MGGWDMQGGEVEYVGWVGGMSDMQGGWVGYAGW